MEQLSYKLIMPVLAYVPSICKTHYILNSYSTFRHIVSQPLLLHHSRYERIAIAI
jgi:hypothetical protein